MIDDTPAVAARAAAEALAPRYGPRLAANVEAAIHAGDGQPQGPPTPAQYLDPVALGALIVSIAQLGYQIYCDRKKGRQQPTQEEIARVIRIERRRHSDLHGEEFEIINIVSAKIIEHEDE